MPIKPIDLQTMFVQLSQVGKQQAAEKDGSTLHSLIHNAQQKKIEDEAAKSVQRPKDDQNAMQAIKDEGGSGTGNAGSDRKHENQTDEAPGIETISDPDLGGHIDISG